MTGLVLVVALGGYAAWHYLPGVFAGQRVDLLWHTVGEETLRVTIIERGTLEAADNTDIICKVKATRGSLNATTIKWVIDDGTQVKKGDRLLDLDKSGLEDQKITQQIAVDKANGDVIAADGQLRIVESQNTTDLSSAETALALAKLDYEKYIDKEGEYQQLLHDVEGRLKQAESDLEIVRERAAWSQRMVQKKFLSNSQAEADDSRLKSADLSVAKITDERKVLTQFTKKREETDRSSKVKEAERAMERVKIQNKAKFETAASDLKTKKGVLFQEKEKLSDLEEQIAACTMAAPKDGMAVYYADDRSRSGFGSQQSVIAQGEPVREGQKLIRIPNLDHMLVNTRVHEAMVSRVRLGMQVDVKIDAFPDRVMRASVRGVATVAIQNDWRSADVKMYQTMVSIDETLPGLKPGMSAEVIIHVEATEKMVPTLPVQAIVGGPEMGPKRKVFVKGAGGQPEEREIEIGLSNDKIAEVRSGLKAGDEVVLNPKVLVGDSARTRQAGDFNNRGGEAGPGGKPGGPGGPGVKPGGPGVTPGGPGMAPSGPGAVPGGKPAGPGGPGAYPGGTPGGPAAGGPRGPGGPGAVPGGPRGQGAPGGDPSKFKPPAGGGGPAPAASPM